MDTDHLKALAERLQTFLESKGHSLKYGQALELIAAIPGLRNWSEVTAFSDRVAAATISEHSVQRLCARLLVKRGVQMGTIELLAAFATPVAEETEEDEPLRIWPDGPAPGIYITTDEKAVSEAIQTFISHNPEAVMYCESAWSDRENAIDLGESGIYSKGLQRAPRGTLIVLGPLDMTQEAWDENRDRLRAATNHAIAAGHRVVVLFKTFVEDRLHLDVAQLVRWEDSPPNYVDDMLRGTVADDGKLVEVAPFVQAWPAPTVVIPTPSFAFPAALASELEKSMRSKQTGIVLMCEAPHKHQFVFLEAALPLIARGRPVARIVPQMVMHYSSEEPLSPYFKDVPLCSSIESAYAQGYRVMVMERGHDREAQEELLKYSEDVCFLVSAYGPASSAVFQGLPFSHNASRKTGDALICILGVATIEAKSGTYRVYDAFVPHGQNMPAQDTDLFEFVEAHRSMRWEEGVAELLERGLVTRKEVETSLRGYSVDTLSKLLKDQSETPSTALAGAVE